MQHSRYSGEDDGVNHVGANIYFGRIAIEEE